MRSPLCELALKYDTDKCPEWRGGTGHEYTPFYHHYLFRDLRPKRVLEIGICTGASLRMWEEYWPEAVIWGADVDRNTFINEDRIKSLYVDQRDDRSLVSLSLWFWEQHLDLIIDDGSHSQQDQWRTAQTLIPCLNPGGLYVIEDVQLGTQEKVREHIPYHTDLYELRTDKRSDNRLIVVTR